MNKRKLEYSDTAGRLIKVVLPPSVVRSMDSAIGGSEAYSDRAEFVADAVLGHLAELQALAHAPRRTAYRGSIESPGSTRSSNLAAVSSIPPIPEGIPTLAPSGPTSDSPTWGMHNRDYPTIWALWHLADATNHAGEPIAFDAWLVDLIGRGWELKDDLNGSHFDTSGFPGNRQKKEASEARFARFFVAIAPDEGPLFDLGLAGARDDQVIAPTAAGVSLLRRLEGFSCERGIEPRLAWTRAYLSHLASAAPADLKFLLELSGSIESGHNDRASLLDAVTDSHPKWSPSVVQTNIAGFVGRAREWGLLKRKQSKGKYKLTALGRAILSERGLEADISNTAVEGRR